MKLIGNTLDPIAAALGKRRVWRQDVNTAMLAELDHAVDAALDQMKGFGYSPGYFIKMRREMGTLAAFRALIAKSAVSEGFTRLALEGRLDLSVEAIALRFPELFSETELATCRERLRPEAPPAVRSRQTITG